MTVTGNFLKGHRLRALDIDMHDLVNIFREEMKSGLEGKAGALRMIPTYIEAENDFIKDTPVLAIDAGGTNFRASIISISRSGEIETGDIVNYSMPGLEGEISSREFFGTMADYIRPLSAKTKRIGFCFSYPTEILPDRDGRLLQFCKEVKASEVEGQLIGKNLLAALGTPGKQIVILNDTVATLLAGKSASAERSYDSFIGYILGTGTNTCYIEKNINIVKNRNIDPAGSQIINIESGDFSRPPRSGPDIHFDSTTANPGSYMFEKMFSGGYFGNLALFIIKTAAREGVFSDGPAERIFRVNSLTTWEADNFVTGINTEENILNKCFPGEEDAENCKQIINTLIDRAAKLVASNLAAVVLHTGKGKSAGHPVLVTVEGTTFYKLFNFRENFERYFSGYLSGERERYVGFTEVPHSSLIGAALAALIEQS
jgi:hexokinase